MGIFYSYFFQIRSYISPFLQMHRVFKSAMPDNDGWPFPKKTSHMELLKENHQITQDNRQIPRIIPPFQPPCILLIERSPF